MLQTDALFDIRVHVVDADAKSYSNCPSMDVLALAEKEKKGSMELHVRNEELSY